MKIKTLKLSKITIGGCYLEGLLCVKKKEPADFQQVLQTSCGERGIRTPGTSRYGSFQDYCNRPLYHLSKMSKKHSVFTNAAAKVRNFVRKRKTKTKTNPFFMFF